jgi:putative DNA primase/helicase
MLRKWEYISSVEKFSLREINLPATAFDSNQDILVVLNGTLDFAEGVFREHRPSDNATVRSPIAFDPAAECPKWIGFLERFFPDVETRVYLARAVGYSLTGRVHGDALFFAYGKGANGKSTFYGVLKILLGDLMTTVPIAALLAAKSDNNFDYHKASMEGKRVVLTDEIPEGRKLADSQVKAITGGDAMNARRPFESPYSFNPTHKLWLMGNHKPEITGTDEGIWRRVHLIPFLVTIAENERRPRHEILAEFEAEAAGILNWAIRGLLESRDIGLRPPAQVVDATKDYRDESDQFGAFLTECTEKHLGHTVRVSDLSKIYLVWCERNGETPRYRGTRKIKSVMIDRGFSSETNAREYPVINDMRLKIDEQSNILELAG